MFVFQKKSVSKEKSRRLVKTIGKFLNIDLAKINDILVNVGATNPSPPMSTGPAPPAPIGYPTNDPSHGSAAPVKVETNSKGDGFFKGW